MVRLALIPDEFWNFSHANGKSRVPTRKRGRGQPPSEVEAGRVGVGINRRAKEKARPALARIRPKLIPTTTPFPT